MTTSPAINSISLSPLPRRSFSEGGTLITSHYSLLTVLLLTLVCFALTPVVRAVSPAPDGGYPGSNTAEGTNALFSRTTGAWNTALGFQALYHDTSGSSNTATGLNALFSNTTGKQNTANGVFTLSSNTTGSYNIATGYQALLNNTIGEKNVATGYQALNTNTTGNDNTAIGFQALLGNDTGDFNTATGFQALLNNKTGGLNTANGYQALLSNETGIENTAIGDTVLLNNTTGSSNTAIGGNALGNSTSGDGNIALGFHAGNGVTTASNVIAIGAGGDDVSNSCFIANIRGKTTARMDAITVVIDTAGQLGTLSSSRRYKNEIKAMEQASEAILSLKPVTFHYKSDTKGTPQFGLIAEEVAEVNPDLVVRDENGEIYTVRYEAVNAMLLNEFLKEHRKVEELNSRLAKQEATIAQQQKGMEGVTARLDAQDSKIQKVNDKVEMSRPAPRTVIDNQ